MPSFLLALLEWVGKLLLQWAAASRAPTVASEAQALGATQAQLQTEVQTNAEVAKGVTAWGVVAQRVGTPGGLQDYTATDPNNRDNQAGLHAVAGVDLHGQGR